ncbi:MAG TPA: S-methyl-5'-thioadenosine phosphorylase [Polyangia bacterium]|jgi:5'-methylthioadenosine phosphorylase|nr:S-methyl-5'-thioadenosine phosphorylase [Polyangia bacterium]
MILGVLGGSGLYELEGFEDVREHGVSTPFGDPSGPIVAGRLGDARLLFLPRHGRGHRFLPSEINYRANVHALKQLGAERVLSISAVGSLRGGVAPGDVVLVDQFIDRTYGRATSFFGDGVVGHVSFAEPVCAELVAAAAGAARAAGFTEAPRGARDDDARDREPGAAARRGPLLYRGGTYVCMEGPQFSTRAESRLHRSWGADTIGMTAVTEAKLCREAELCFAVLALVTDFDSWHDDEAPVTADAVVATLLANVARARDVIRRMLPTLADAGARTCACGQAAAHAIMTAPEAIPASTRERLRALYGRYL